MSELAAALQIAIKVHADQRDKQDQPYLLHVLRVVEAVSDEAKTVASLHDCIEDGGEEALAAVNVIALSRTERQALELLTRSPAESYADYIAQIAGEDARTWTDQKAILLAREVKIADLRDNLGRIPPKPKRLGRLEPNTWPRDWGSLKARYERAISTLETT
jgi:hypothetical protein